MERMASALVDMEQAQQRGSVKLKIDGSTLVDRSTSENDDTVLKLLRHLRDSLHSYRVCLSLAPAVSLERGLIIVCHQDGFASGLHSLDEWLAANEHLLMIQLQVWHHVSHSPKSFPSWGS